MFGDVLKELRVNNKMTQSELANILNVSTSTIGMYEQNRRDPDTKTVNKIADYFEVTTDYLLGHKNIEKNKDNEEDNEITILNRHAKKMTSEQRKKLIEIAKIMFTEEFKDNE